MSTLEGIRIAFVGGGIMAEATMRGLVAGNIAQPAQIIVSDPLAARRSHLANTLSVGTCEANGEAVAGADVVVLAIKPQTLGSVLRELAGALGRDTLVLSIVAGAAMSTIQAAWDCKALVRVMPNTPGQVGEGISVWTATPGTPAYQCEWARAIVGSLGEELYVEDEKYVDMATAISGSGPAYVFLFIEALIDAGVHLGFSRPVAEKLVLQTVRGSASYAQITGQHPAVLRNMVTSPGGTTAEALCKLEEGGLRTAISQAVWACYEKALRLGGHTKS